MLVWGIRVASDAQTFVPAGCDTVMLTPHHWFMGPPSKPRTLESLIETYHASVGSNCVLELGMAVDHTGVVPADQATLAADFGAWVKHCYGSPVGVTTTDSSRGSVVTLNLEQPTKIDRVSIGEDLSFGQHPAITHTPPSPPPRRHPYSQQPPFGPRTPQVPSGNSGQQVPHVDVLMGHERRPFDSHLEWAGPALGLSQLTDGGMGGGGVLGPAGEGPGAAAHTGMAVSMSEAGSSGMGADTAVAGAGTEAGMATGAGTGTGPVAHGAATSTAISVDSANGARAAKKSRVSEPTDVSSATRGPAAPTRPRAKPGPKPRGKGGGGGKAGKAGGKAKLVCAPGGRSKAGGGGGGGMTCAFRGCDVGVSSRHKYCSKHGNSRACEVRGGGPPPPKAPPQNQAPPPPSAPGLCEVCPGIDQVLYPPRR